MSALDTSDVLRNINPSPTKHTLSLPVEISSAIFRLCLTQSTIFFIDNEKDCICQPVALSGVCALWRDVAISTSQLWRTIVLLLDPNAVEMHRAYLEALLYRSGNRSLIIKLAHWKERDD